MELGHAYSAQGDEPRASTCWTRSRELHAGLLTRDETDLDGLVTSRSTRRS
jgi:hypothetical protein